LAWHSLVVVSETASAALDLDRDFKVCPRRSLMNAGSVLALVASSDGLRLASVGEDATLKYFDVLNFDMTGARAFSLGRVVTL
jgi:WD40 repeat protein